MILFRTLCVIFFSTLFFSPSFADFNVPKLTSPVVDNAQLIPPQQQQQLAGAIQKLYKSGGSQVQVLTVSDLGGDTIEQASIKVVDQWKLGNTETDKGVLLFVAQKERRIRIEVGQGLEGDLTDAYSKRIIDEVMVPLFRAGHPESGILLGVINIVERTDPKFPFKNMFEAGSFQSRDKVKKEKSLLSRIFSLLFLLIMIILFIKNPMLFLLLMSGGGGRGGGFGGGGGGWSGGGGGFSGGGASGGW